MGTGGFSHVRISRRGVVKGAAAVGVVGAAAGVPRLEPLQQAAAQSGVEQIAAERGLTPADVSAALKTYVPSGRWDDYLIFASGGHSGQVLVFGVPSMRLLKLIGVFTPSRGRAMASPMRPRPFWQAGMSMGSRSPGRTRTTPA